MSGKGIRPSFDPGPPHPMDKLAVNGHLPASLTESTSAAMFVIVIGVLTYVNPPFEKLAGYFATKLLGIKSSDFFSTVIPQPACADMTNPEHRDFPIIFETSIATRGGKSRRISFSLNPMGISQDSALLGTATDITRYKEREEAVARSERKYKTIFDLAPDMIFVHNSDGVIIDLNPVAASGGMSLQPTQERR